MSKVKVTNRSDSVVGYYIPEINLARDFAPNESKEVEVDELQKVIYQPGGQELIDAYLRVEDVQLANEISPWVAQEPEYFYTPEDVKRLLTTGDLDELKDCLDFGPDGTKELVKSLAISLPCTDTNKLEVIQDYFHINIRSMIDANKEEKEAEVAPKRERRTAGLKPNDSGESPKERRTVNKYNVINRK